MKEHELDQFMTALENAGILTGWSKFIGNDGPKDDLSESEQKETISAVAE